jgi:four helix bundle protein
MGTSLEDLKVLQIAENIADDVWRYVITWDVFARDVLGSQLARATDSIGANIAESFGRFNFGEKVQFLYYARGSLFETKYWLNRSANRGLLRRDIAQSYANRLTELARQINRFASSLKIQKSELTMSKPKLREERIEYSFETVSLPLLIFDDEAIVWIASDAHSSPISNL